MEGAWDRFDADIAKGLTPEESLPRLPDETLLAMLATSRPDYRASLYAEATRRVARTRSVVDEIAIGLARALDDLRRASDALAHATRAATPGRPGLAEQESVRSARTAIDAAFKRAGDAADRLELLRAALHARARR